MVRIERQQKHLFYSLVLHVVLLSILVISFDFTSPMPVLENTHTNEVINAMVIQSAPITPRKRIPLPPKIVEPNPSPIKPLEQQKPPIKKTETLTDAIIIPDKKQKKVKENLIQKQLLADLKKQTDTKKKAQQQKTIESDFAQEMKALKAKSLEQQLAKEAERLDGVQKAQMRGVVDKYKALILQSISQHWLVPHNADKHLFAELLIRIAPGGMVLDVQVIKSSGDDALDRSARAAVFKASPLPVPTDSNEFEPFRQFGLRVKPENIQPSSGATMS